CYWENGREPGTTRKLLPNSLAPRVFRTASGRSRPRPEMSSKLEVAPGIVYWPGFFEPAEQAHLLNEVLARVAEAPFYRPAMPGSGKPLSVEMTNFGPLGWVTDQAKGYRYEPTHPATGAPWPDISRTLLRLWADATGYPA